MNSKQSDATTHPLSSNGTSRDKSKRDVAALKQHARFVIVLDESGNTALISNPPHRYPNRKIVPLIAVVTNVSDGQHRFEASVAEIGLARTRPYQRVHINRNKVLLQSRNTTWQLTATQLQQVYATILACLDMYLTETRLQWQSDEPWFVNGVPYERGVRISVSHCDTLLCQSLLHESVRYFNVGVCAKYIQWINWQLRYSKYDSYHKNLYGKNVRAVAASVASSTFVKNPFWFEALLQQIGRRTLLENALLHRHGFLTQPSTETELAFKRPPVKLPHVSGLLFWHTLKQPGNKSRAHAKNCTRFEVFFDRHNPKHRRERADGFFSHPIPKEFLHDPSFCPF